MMYNTMRDTDKQNYIKGYYTRSIEKTSSGLGFFIFAYYCSMVAMSFILTFVLIMNNMFKGIDFNGTEDFDISSLFYMQIIGSVFSAFIPGLFYFLISGKKMSDTIKTNYVRQKELWAIVFVGMGVAMLANTVSDLIQTNFNFFGLENTVEMSQSAKTPSEIALYIISTAVVPAFAEEFAFRGILMGTLRKYGDSFAIITSAVLFGAMHGNIVQIPFAFIAGLIFAFVDCKTNSILPSIIIHFINNFYAVILDVLRSSSMFSDRIFLRTYYIIIIAFCVLALLAFLYLIKKDRNYFRISDKSQIQSGNEILRYLTLKERVKAFFINPGVLLVSILFVITTIFTIGFIRV